jgi:DNA-binding protein H-NS
MDKINTLSVNELIALREKIDGEIATKREADRDATRQQIIAIATEAGYTIEELFAVGKRAASAPKAIKSADGRSKVAPKYQDPLTGTTWTGRGKRPKWMQAAMASGQSQESLLIRSP